MVRESPQLESSGSELYIGHGESMYDMKLMVVET